jgi:hypothetical protein
VDDDEAAAAAVVAIGAENVKGATGRRLLASAAAGTSFLDGGETTVGPLVTTAEGGVGLGLGLGSSSVSRRRFLARSSLWRSS